jgi:hypothetical protein
VLTTETSAAVPAADRSDFEYEPLPWVIADPQPATRQSWRSVISALLAVASVVCLLLGNVALWMRQDLYSARAVGREAQQIMGAPDVQQAVANLVMTGVVEPALHRANLGPLTSVVSGPVVGLARRAVENAVASQPAQQIASRLVQQVVPELDKGTGPVALSPDQLAWVVSPRLAANRIVADVLRTADQTGCCRVVLVQRGQMSFAWRHVRGVRTAGVVLPPLGLASGALAVVVSRRRLRMAMILAGAAAAVGIATVASLWAGPGPWAGLMSNAGPAAGVVRAAQRTVFDSATAGLRQHSVLLAGAGILLLAALAFGGLITRRSPARRPTQRPRSGRSGPSGSKQSWPASRPSTPPSARQRFPGADHPA